MGMKRRLLNSVATAIVSIFGVATLLSACSVDNDEVKIDLGSYEWAVFMSEYRDTSFIPRASNGYVVLVRADGSYGLVEHAGMDSGEISWTKHGINFADATSDHWITEQDNSAIEQERVGLMDGLVTLSDGVTRVGVYNGGFQENGYREEVVVARPESSEHHKLNTAGFYPLISACGDDVYGAYAMTPEDGNTRFIFDQIVDEGAVVHTTVTTDSLPFSEVGFYTNDAPCAGDRIYFLGKFLIYDGVHLPEDKTLSSHMRHETDGHKHAFALVVVDTHTGSLDWLPLVTDNGENLELSLEDVEYSALDASSLDGSGNVVWIGGNGVLYRTEVTTGKTSVLNDDLRSSSHDGVPDLLYHFTSDAATATVLVEDNQDPLTMPRIVTFDKTTGEMLKSVQINGLKDEVPESMILRDIAQKPTK